MVASTEFVFAICCAALAVAMGTASTIPPQAATTQQHDQQNMSSTVPASVSNNATVAETETPATNTNTTTTAAAAAATTTSINTETAPRPQPPYDCYDCNSGSPLPGFWRNGNCDESGYVAQWYLPSACETFCFSSVGLYPAGTVFRGCAIALHLPGHALEDGCFEDVANKRHVCLCSGDQCNTHNLTAWSQHYAEKYMNMKTTTPSSESNSVH